MIAKFLNLIKSYQYNIFLGVCIALISFVSYNLGKINSGTKTPIKITEGVPIFSASREENRGSSISQPNLKANLGEIGTNIRPTPKPLDLRVVVSKASDSKRYHYSWCNTWKRIKVENQLWFNNEQEAISAGYTLAGNCLK